MSQQVEITSHTITLDGERLTYVTAGDPAAPPVVLVHGWMSYAGVWRSTQAALQSRYYTVAVDLLGFGDSAKPAHGDYSIAAQGQRVLKLADALGFERFTLIGHSMGGQIALHIAACQTPDRIVRLVDVAGVAAAKLTSHVEHLYPLVTAGRWLPWGYRVNAALNRYPWFVRAQYRAWFYRIDSLPLAAWAEDRQRACQPGCALPSYAAMHALRALDLTPHLAAITAPTLVIFGARDGTVPIEQGRLVARTVPDVRLVEIDDCGHFPMYEQPAAYLDALRGFLNV